MQLGDICVNRILGILSSTSRQGRVTESVTHNSTLQTQENCSRFIRNESKMIPPIVVCKANIIQIVTRFTFSGLVIESSIDMAI